MAKKAPRTRSKPTARTARAEGGSSSRSQPLDLGRALVQAFLVNERINQVLLALVDPSIWRAFPKSSPRRNIATSFAHIHNVRCMRLKMSGRGQAVPARLERGEISMDEARTGLAASARAMAELVERALAAGGRVPDYPPDVVSMVCAALAHEAHHRGQICHWARELGAPISPEKQLLLWSWNDRWKEVAGAADARAR